MQTVQKKAAAKYDPDSDMPVADEFSDEGEESEAEEGLLGLRAGPTVKQM